jgi:aryl-alcohol dehydrogenase-like predicted oxidoreductase
MASGDEVRGGPAGGSPLPQRTIGDRSVSAIGLGGMPMSITGRPDRAQAIATIHAALDRGATLIDTADAYCLNEGDTGHNEELIAEALGSWGGNREQVVVATKGGHVRGRDGSWLTDGRREHLRAACEASLRRLGVETIDLYQFHRPDPKVPFLESVGAVAELRDEGKVRLVGLSNVTVDQLEQAREIAPIASVQNQFSPDFRSSEPELERCAALGIAFLSWGPLGGVGAARQLGEWYPVLARVAADRGTSVAQVALAWALAKAPVVIPIPGSRRPETILDSLSAVDLALTDEEMAAIDAGDRR